MKQYLERQYAETVHTVGIAVIEAEDQAEEGAVDDEQLLDISNLSWTYIFTCALNEDADDDDDHHHHHLGQWNAVARW